MSCKGYIQSVSEAGAIRSRIDTLEKAGVALDDILIAGSIVQVLEGVCPGDELLLNSFAECGCGSIRELLRVLREALGRRITVRSLEEPALDTGAQGVLAIMESIVQVDSVCRGKKTRTALRRLRTAGKKLGRPVGSTKNEMRLQQCARLYYRNQQSVHILGRETGITPRTLYRYLSAKGLPSRSRVEKGLSENPFPAAHTLEGAHAGAEGIHDTPSPEVLPFAPGPKLNLRQLV